MAECATLSRRERCSLAAKIDLIITGYNVSWGRTVCLLPQDMPIIQTSKDICQTVSCEEGGNIYVEVTLHCSMATGLQAGDILKYYL